VLLGPIISRFFACSNEGEINKKNIDACSSPISVILLRPYRPKRVVAEIPSSLFASSSLTKKKTF
jgi:hypothetical protein